MGLSSTTGSTLEKVGRYQSQHRALPLSPGLTGHASEQTGSHEAIGGRVDAGTGARHAVGLAFAKALEIEKRLSAPIAKLPWPGLWPALEYSQIWGMPHAHKHPPNMPPEPPLPLPSSGPIQPFPGISVAERTFIKHRRAARCGDIALSIWCGGYTPLTEVYTGSASVWIEGARATRMADITWHCIASVTKLKIADGPLGLPVGAVQAPFTNIYIGGAPMPSLTAMALAAGTAIAAKPIGLAAKAALKAARAAAAEAFRLASSIARRVELALENAEARALRRFHALVEVGGDGAYKKAFCDDMRQIAKTPIGRKMMNDAADRGLPYRFKPVSEYPADRLPPGEKAGPCAQADGWSTPHTTPDSSSPYMKDGQPARVTGPGNAQGGTVYYDAGKTVENTRADGTVDRYPSDVTAAHEMSHMDSNGRGTNQYQLKSRDENWNKKWGNVEEHKAVTDENTYRKQRGGIGPRTSY